MDSTIEPRIENSVLHAPTSMVPTAMGRTMLYQTEYETTSQPAFCPRAQAVRQVGIEEQQQRNQHPPRQYAARCVDRRKLRPDDVADADQRGRKVGRGPVDASGVDHVADGFLFEIEMVHHGFRKGEKPFDVLAEDLQALVGLQDLQQPGEAHGAEHVFGRVAALVRRP